MSILYIACKEAINMGDKILSKHDLQKRAKIDDEKFQFFIDQKILEEKESYTEKDIDRIREFRKINPLELYDIVKRFKLSSIADFLSSVRDNKEKSKAIDTMKRENKRIGAGHCIYKYWRE